MKKLIFILLMSMVTNLRAQEITIFTDGFTNLNKLSAHSNVKITNISLTNYLTVSNYPGIGYAISTEITLPENYKWHYLYVNYSYIGSGGGPTYLSNYILRSSDDLVIASTTNKLYDISNITSKTIKLKVKLSATLTKEPILDFWKVTATSNKTPIPKYTPRYPYLFYGAPTPFKIGSKPMRFYRKFSKPCRVTLKIYDLRYRLVKVVQKDKFYDTGSNLDAVWDGKNGNGYTVRSGVYIAVLEIINEDGTIDKPDPFSFAVVR